LNEGLTIGPLVAAFRRQAGVRVVVCDNGSSDATAGRASDAGSEVIVELRPGKARAVAALLAASRAPVVVLVDGDSTYAADDLPVLMAPVLRGDADMAVGRRRPQKLALAPHRWLGNRVLTGAFNLVHDLPVVDLLSGYRVLDGDLARAVRFHGEGFEVEVELGMLAAREGWRVVEVDVSYNQRPPGSTSKLSAVRDGVRILRSIVEGR
jgi:glycosyltransferase involved in cell wall biosynthesis